MIEKRIQEEPVFTVKEGIQLETPLESRGQ